MTTRILSILFILLSLYSCNKPKKDKKNEPQKKQIALVIHGGAGNIERGRFTPEQEKEYMAALTVALEAGYKMLEEGQTSTEVVKSTIVLLENSPLFNAGKGAVFNSDGIQEMDASIMEGHTLNAGAIAGVHRIKNPILAAAIVMDSSRHVMLSGDGAERLAQQYGIEMVDPSYFYTEKRYKQLERARGTAQLEHPDDAQDWKYGTVGAVAMDQSGNISAGTSTGGITNKKYGRIGDSPIIGAGTYARNATCGISCTGTGEYFIRVGVGHEISSLMQYEGYSLKQAMDEVIHTQVGGLGGDGGVIGLDSYGRPTWSFNTGGMFRGYKVSADKTVVEMYEEKK